MNVSNWFAGMSLCLSLIASQANAAGPNIAMSEGSHQDSSKPANELVVNKHSLAAHLGLTTEDATFSAPRNFRTESFNSEHFELEPLAADKDEAGS